MSSAGSTYRRVRRTVLARRRLLAAVFTALAVLSLARVVAPAPAATSSVVTAAHDLPSGVRLEAGDLVTVAYDARHAPSGLLSESQLIGRTLAAPLRAGEPLTDLAVVRPSALAGYPGLVATPVRLGDAGAVALLRVGDAVDLVAAMPDGGTARTIATGARVVALPAVDDDVGSLDDGALIIVAIAPQTALGVAEASVSAFISVVLRG